MRSNQENRTDSRRVVPRERPLPPELFIRLARHWSSARQSGINPLPEMTRQADRLAAAVTLAPASESLLQLVEANLGRRLTLHAPGGSTSSPDENALLILLRIGARPERAGTAPHGLSGALQWAVRSVRIGLGMPPDPPMLASASPVPTSCPFMDILPGRTMRNVSGARPLYGL